MSLLEGKTLPGDKITGYWAPLAPGGAQSAMKVVDSVTAIAPPYARAVNGTKSA